MANSTSKAEQARLLAELLDAAKLQAGLMKRAIEKNDLKDVLKHSAVMLGELRTGALTPRSYYELYLSIFDYLGTLEQYFANAVLRGGTPAADIYEAVQHAGNVLPRLYLMITAGAVYIRSGQAAARDVLADLSEYVRGVQHPQRGLFVRYYLIQRMKDRLPDNILQASLSSSFSSAGGGGGGIISGDGASTSSDSTSSATKDSIHFLTGNLIEMNRLWVRMQTPAGGVVRNRKRRERERLELRVLVGANLTRLAAVRGVDLPLYQKEILPGVTAEVIACKDKIAQAYLVEGLLQVFPMELHTRTLDTLLGLLPQLVRDHITLKTVALAILVRITEGATVHGADDDVGGDSTTKQRQQQKQSVQKAAPSVLGLPTPPVVAGILPPDVDVFGSILSYISGLAADAQGPFRPVTTEKAAGGSNANKDSDDEGGSGLPGSPGTSPVKTSSLSRPGGGSGSAGSGKLAALRAASDIAVAAQPMASLLEIFHGLLTFTLQLYPTHKPYVDAVLGAASKSLRDILHVKPALDPFSVVASTPPVGESATAGLTGEDTSEARKALDHLLDAAANSGTASTSSKISAQPPSAPGIISSTTTTSSSSAPSLPLDEPCSKLIVAILESAQKAMGLEVLALTHYAPLMAPLAYRHKRVVSAKLLEEVLEHRNNNSNNNSTTTTATTSSSSSSSSSSGNITDEDTARRLYASLLPLIRDDDATPADALREDEEKSRFTTEQGNMATLISLLGPSAAGKQQQSALEPLTRRIRSAADAMAAFEVLCVARDFLSWGGPHRVCVTYPALLHASMNIVEDITLDGKKGSSSTTSATTTEAFLKRVFTFAHDVCFTLAVAEHGELALKMFLEAGKRCGDSQFAHEFFSQAFLLYEDLPDSKRQSVCLHLIISSLCECTSLDAELYTALATRATQVSTRLLKKSDQVKALLAAAHLFWKSASTSSAEYFKPREVLACLQRALRTADATLPPSPILFVDVLNSYLHFLELGVPSITQAYVQELVVLASQHVAAVASSSSSIGTSSNLAARGLNSGAGSGDTDVAAYLQSTISRAAAKGVPVPAVLTSSSSSGVKASTTSSTGRKTNSSSKRATAATNADPGVVVAAAAAAVPTVTPEAETTVLDL